MAMPRSYGVSPEDGVQTPRSKRNSTRRGILISLLILPVIVAIVYSLFQEKGILWLFQIKTDFPEVDLAEDLATILAPLTALALAIERIIETVFDLIEQSTNSMARLIGESKDAIRWVEQEYSNASHEVKKGVEKISLLKGDTPGVAPGTDDEVKAAENKLKQAEERLGKAAERLSGLTRDPIYIQMKRALSIMIGLFLGFLVAIFSDQGIFAYLQQGVPRIVDIFVTGFIIGAGSGPMHSLLGILQGFKDTLSNLGKTVDLDPIKEEIEKLKSGQNPE